MIHRAIRADEDVRVDLSTIHLEGAVAEWWQALINLEGPIDDWATLRRHYEAEYYSPAMRDEMRDEFLALRQGSMTVAEYVHRYSRMFALAGSPLPPHDFRS